MNMQRTQYFRSPHEFRLLNYYEAIEQASQDMLEAARVRQLGPCRQARRRVRGADRAAQAHRRRGAAGRDEAQLKSRIMQRILVNDAEIRQLAEPWLEDLDNILAGRPKTLH